MALDMNRQMPAAGRDPEAPELEPRDKRWRKRIEVPAAYLGPASGRARWVWGLVLAACVVLAFFVRAGWYLADDLEPAFTHAGYPSLTSVDGYHFAAGVGAATTDSWGEGARVAEPERHALVALGAALVELGISREALFTWLPPLLGALVVVPLFALGWFAGGRWAAMLAGLGGAFAPAHVGRTTVGYFDTDVFSVTVPLGVAALFVAALRAPGRRPPWALLAGAFLLALYPFTYDQGRPLGLAMAVAFGIVLWVGPWLGVPKVPWRAAGLFVLSAAILPVPVPFAMLAVVVAFLLLWFVSRRGGEEVATETSVRRARLVEAGGWVVLVAVVALSPATTSLFQKAELYASAGQAAVDSPSDELDPATDWAIADTTPSVSEARILPAEAMFAKSAGHGVPFALGLLGLALMCLAVPSLATLAPLIGVGLFAFVGGHRFLVYLAPVLSLGVAWLVVRGVAAWPTRHVFVQRVALVTLGAVCVLPAAMATVPMKPRPVLVAGEVAELEALAAHSTPGDTTIAWWDYGYPLAYHAKTRVVADGARRRDEASLVAEILLTHDEELARRLAWASALAEKAAPDDAARETLGRARAEGLTPDQWLRRVAEGRWANEAMESPAEVFLYLPLRMMPVVPVIASYRLGPDKQVELRRYPGVRPDRRRLILRDGLEVDADTVSMRRRDPSGAWQTRPLRSIHSVSGTGPGRVVREKAGTKEAGMAGVFLVDLALFVELDAGLLESTWARLFLFEEPSQAFELVSSSAGAKVFRVRQPSPPTR